MKLSSPIFAFTLASTSLHAGIFLVTDHVNLTLPGSTGSVMSVKLESKTNKADVLPADSAKQESSSRPTLKPLTALAKKPEAALTADAKPEYKPQKQKLKQSAHTSTSSDVTAASRAHVISIVYEQLSNHFEYPRIAQLHNWQGKVVLAFRVTTKGEIENIQVNRSSGFAILDHAAINSLKEVGKLPLLATGIKTGMEIQLPILYQLTEG